MTDGHPGEVIDEHDGRVDQNAHQGKFGEQLTQLIVASAGFQCSKPEDLGDGIDVTISRTHPDSASYVRPPNVDLQVKASRKLRSVGNDWSFDLEVHHYNVLRAPGATPRYLVVVDLRSEDAADWIGYGEDFTVFHRAAYYTSLCNKPPTENSGTIAVRIPKKNVFTQLVVRRMMGDARRDFLAMMAAISHRGSS